MDNNFRKEIEYRPGQKNTNNQQVQRYTNNRGNRPQQPIYQQMQNSQSVARRAISNTPKTISRSKFTGKNIKKIIAGILAISAVSTAGIGIYNNYQTNQAKEVSSESKIVERMKENWDDNLTKHDISFDNDGNIIVDKKLCPEQANTLKLLQSTDLDEKINDYYKAKNNNDTYKMQQIEQELEKSKSQLINFNRDLLVSVIADGSDLKPEDINLDYRLIYRDEQEKEKILRGEIFSKGHYLTVNSLEAFTNNANSKFNYNQINENLFDFMSDIQYAYEAPQYSNPTLEKVLSNYNQLKVMIDNGYTININNKEMEVLDRNGKKQEVSKSIISNTLKFKEDRSSDEIDRD